MLNALLTLADAYVHSRASGRPHVLFPAWDGAHLTAPWDDYHGPPRGWLRHARPSVLVFRRSQLTAAVQVAPLALLLLYDEGYKAWCPGVHRISCSLSTGHRASLLWASMAVSPTASVHSFVGRFTATPWGYTNKLFGVEMLLGWEGAENRP